MRTEFSNVCGISHFIPQTRLQDGFITSTLKVIKLFLRKHTNCPKYSARTRQSKIQSQVCFRQTTNYKVQKDEMEQTPVAVGSQRKENFFLMRPAQSLAAIDLMNNQSDIPKQRHKGVNILLGQQMDCCALKGTIHGAGELGFTAGV